MAEAGVPTARTFTNPEFFRQGTAVADYQAPSRAVIGRFPDADPAALANVSDALVPPDVPTLIVDVTEAEVVKNGTSPQASLNKCPNCSTRSADTIGGPRDSPVASGHG